MTRRVLHVTDRWGGGIATVVQQYVSATPEYEHYLVCRDNSWNVRDERGGLFKEVFALPKNPAAAAGRIVALVASHHIGVVHAHSSTAGAIVRLRALPARVVYTPNAFALLAPRGTTAWLLGQSERLLGLRGIVMAPSGADEERLAGALSKRSGVVRIFNRPDDALSPRAAYAPVPRVVMCGRLCRQKDPSFMIDLVAISRAAGRDYSFSWLGDGDLNERRRLEAAGVAVSGWLALDDLHARQSRATVYMHTARYEGSCLSVLDAAAMGLPSLGRPVPGVRDVPWIKLVSTPEDALSAIDALCDPIEWATASKTSLDGILAHSLEAQRTSLLTAYGGDGT